MGDLLDVLQRTYADDALEGGLIGACDIAAATRVDAIAARVHTAEAREVTAQLHAAGVRPSVSDLALWFERLRTDRKAEGVFFTPRPIADFLARWAVQGPRDVVVDPASGGGALLLAAADRLLALGARSRRRIVCEQLRGVDIDADSVRRAGLLLAVWAAAGGEQATPGGLEVGDALRVAPQLGPADAVVANPPYVRYQTLPEDTRALVRTFESMEGGNVNLYMPFFEIAHRILGADGRCALITPNSFLHVRAATALRAWLARERACVRIIDFGSARTFEAATYSAISLGTRRPGEDLEYVRIADPSQLSDPPTGRRVSYRDLSGAAWRLGAPRVQPVQSVPLADVVDIRGGLATLRDRLYLVSGPPDGNGVFHTTHGGIDYPIEAEACVPCVRVAGIADQDALEADTGHIIYPYRRDGDAVVCRDAADMAARFPQTYRYLCAIRPALAERDRGRKTYAQWFAYGRTQALLPRGPHLLSPLYARAPRFLREERADRLFVNGLSLRPKEGSQIGAPLSVALLHALLDDCAPLARFMAELGQVIRGDFVHYQPRLLGAFPLPHLCEEDAVHLLHATPSERHVLHARLWRT